MASIDIDGRHTCFFNYIPPKEYLCDNQTDRTVPPEAVEASAVPFSAQTWPKGTTIRVFFMENHAKRSEVLNYAAEWSQHCSIKFCEVNSADQSDIRVRFNWFDSIGSYSAIGTDAKRYHPKAHTMNLKVVNEATVLHEFGHALGLGHEH